MSDPGNTKPDDDEPQPRPSLASQQQQQAQDQAQGQAPPYRQSTPSAPVPPSRDTTPATPVSSTSNPSNTVSSPSRARYVPQFSAATNMILRRIHGQPASLSSAPASSTSTPQPSIPTVTYEDVRRRLVATMNTSATLSMPMPAAASTSRNSGLQSGAAGRAPTGKVSNTSSRETLKGSDDARLPGQKRKRNIKDVSDGDNSDISSPARFSEAEVKENTAGGFIPPTMTKSGRQILKPVNYNPAAEDAARKRAKFGKRTPEQTLCKKCTRMQSPASNQIVFCDGCEDGWHQLCHDPWVDEEVIGDVTGKWYCSTCVPRRERAQPKKKALPVQMKRGSWADRSHDQVNFQSC